MTGRGWKWAFGISLTLLILFVGFLLFIWAAGTLLFTMFAAGTGQELPDYVSLGEFYAGFPGSPLFWPFVADIFVLVLSSVMLIGRRFRKK